MGEYSKRIGEIGESIVELFTEAIGWKSSVRKVDIPNVNIEEDNKKTHGLDGYFQYTGPMISNTVENILISVKYTTLPYPNSPTTTFKEYYEDLASALNSFGKSELKYNSSNYRNNVSETFDRGVLFWLSNSPESYDDLVSKLARIHLPKDFVNSGIFLVDNKRIAFIYDTLLYTKMRYPGAEIDFLYFSTGLNSDERIAKNGKIMPVQYLNSSVIPLRVQQGGETTIVLSCLDSFDREELTKYMGLAKNLGINLQGNTELCFSNYRQSEHAPIVNQLKQQFDDPTFTDRLTVINPHNLLLNN